MYFIKCCVNSSLHNSGCCIRSVAPWITVLLWHTIFTKRVIYYKFTFVRYFAKQGTTHRATSYLAHCLPFLWPREEHRWQSRWVGDFEGQCLLWRLLLRLAAAAVVLFLSFFLLKIVFHISSLRTWFPELVSATRISLLASSLSFIYFFLTIAGYPQWSALFQILCMTWHSCRNIIPVRYEHLQWQQNRSKATMWLLYKVPPIWGCPRLY